MEGIRKLQQDNDINKFRYTLEKALGNSSGTVGTIRDLLGRLFMYGFDAFKGDGSFDQMFNPK